MEISHQMSRKVRHRKKGKTAFRGGSLAGGRLRHPRNSEVSMGGAGRLYNSKRGLSFGGKYEKILWEKEKLLGAMRDLIPPLYRVG